MFSFIFDIGNYEDRKIGRLETESYIISTCAISDSSYNFETGIKKKALDKWFIVENYMTTEEAEAGHERWVGLMAKNPSQELIENGQSHIQQFFNELEEENEED